MTDVHSPEIRSKNMRAIRSADTQPELLIRKSLHAAGLRYRLGGAGLPGRPDLVFPKYRTVIFAHGCFWHGHDCKYFKLPMTRTDFWQTKIQTNRLRDSTAIERLAADGWNVIVVWECALKTANARGADVMVDIVRLLKSFKENPGPTFAEVSMRPTMLSFVPSRAIQSAHIAFQQR